MIDRDTVIQWAIAGGAGEVPTPDQFTERCFVMTGSELLAVAQKAADEERKKHQADIELWKAEAAKAELWRGRCLSMDHGDGRTVQQIQAEAVEGERERAAQIADSAGHHWSGAPAIAMFDIAEAIRNRGIGGGE